jgi:hypothetical protein
MVAPDDTKSTPPDDYDSPWKEVSGRFFPQLVAFFAPDLHAVVDWSAGYEFLEQELREMLRDAETGLRRVDKVVKVRTLAGKPLYLVLHVEIQVSRESGFPRRMFVYFYRLYDLYPEQVVSLAILADEEPDWEPKSYEYAQHGTELEFGYRTVKIWEYNERWAELEKDPNPFALVVMAHLKTKATRGNARERLAWGVEDEVRDEHRTSGTPGRAPRSAEGGSSRPVRGEVRASGRADPSPRREGQPRADPSLGEEDPHRLIAGRDLRDLRY